MRNWGRIRGFARLVLITMIVTSDGRCSIQAAEVLVESWAGPVIGIGQMTIAGPVPAQSDMSFPIAKMGSGVLYPAADSAVHCWFLFDTQRTQSVTFDGVDYALRPVEDEPAAARHLDQWWSAYETQARRDARTGRLSRSLHWYLMSMLSRRLQLPLPDLATINVRDGIVAEPTIETSLAFLTGLETVRDDLLLELLQPAARSPETSLQPLPESLVIPAEPTLNPAVSPAIEPLAMVVPAECFYARVNSVDDLLWGLQTLQDWGGQMSLLVTRQGLNHDISRKLQAQLNLPVTDFVRLVAPHLIREVGLIGSDPFVREGAGLGIVLHSTDSATLRRLLDLQRLQLTQSDLEVSLSEVTLSGGPAECSLLSSADGRIRSYYVVSGDFHLITTSRYIADRFAHVIQDPAESLGAAAEFREARHLMPLDRNDHVFAFVPDRFIRKLTSAQCQIEMARRARSDVEMELVQLAALAAKAESRPAGSLQELINGGFLPADFTRQRPDGSRLVWNGTTVHDSRRGRKGCLVPVMDLAVEQVSADEVQAYQEFAASCLKIQGKIHPVVLGIQRTVRDGQEQLTGDVQTFPFPRSSYPLLGFLSHDTERTFVVRPDNVILQAEARMFDGVTGIAGIMNTEVPFEVQDGELRSGSLESQGVFLGERIQKGRTRFLTPPPAAVPDGTIQEKTGPGDWQTMRSADHVLTSPQVSVLQSLAGSIQLSEAARPAMLRVQMGDLKTSPAMNQTHAVSWIEDQHVLKCHQAVLNCLLTQFRVPSDQLLTICRAVCSAELESVLQNRFDLQTGRPAVVLHPVSVQDYRNPLISRIRGGNLELNVTDQALSVHFDLTIDPPDPSASVSTGRSAASGKL